MVICDFRTLTLVVGVSCLIVDVNYVLRRIFYLYVQKDSLKANFLEHCSHTDTLE